MFKLFSSGGAASMLAARRTRLGPSVPIIITPPSISGTVKHGNTLTATAGTWYGADSVSGQWYADGVAISGETGTTYTVDRADGTIGPDITYRETATNSEGSNTSDSNALAYSPTNVSGLIVWLDSGGDDSSENFSITNDGTYNRVNSWYDKSGNNNNFTDEGASLPRPVWENSVTPTDGAGVRFNLIAGNRLRSSAAVFGASSARTVVICHTPGGKDRYLFDGADGSNRAASFVSFTQQVMYISSPACQINKGSHGSGISVTEAVFNGASSTQRVDGGSRTSMANPGTLTSTKMTLGARYDGWSGSPLDGYVYAVLVYDNAISSGDGLDLYEYLWWSKVTNV